MRPCPSLPLFPTDALNQSGPTVEYSASIPRDFSFFVDLKLKTHDGIVLQEAFLGLSFPGDDDPRELILNITQYAPSLPLPLEHN